MGNPVEKRRRRAENILRLAGWLVESFWCRVDYGRDADQSER